MTELNYRFLEQVKTSNADCNTEIDRQEKMKTVGKIYLDDKATFFGHKRGLVQKTNGGNSYEAIDTSFLSLRTSNSCVVKGRWIYEAQLTNARLKQIGWATMNTRFSNTDGVGDDVTSFAFDGYRNSKWNNGPVQYGDLWDVGDYIGIGIDLDAKTIEFFINGKSQGIAFENIPVGANIAYFPGFSMSTTERLYVNLGQTDFRYSYDGYQPYELNLCTVNGEYEATKQFLELLENKVLKLLCLEEGFSKR